MSQGMTPGPWLRVQGQGEDQATSGMCSLQQRRLNESLSFLLLPHATIGLHPAPCSLLPDLELWDLDQGPDLWFPILVFALTSTTLISFGLKKTDLGTCVRAEGLGSSSLPVPTLGSPGEGLDCCHHPQTVSTLPGISHMPLLFLYSQQSVSTCPVPCSLKLL